MEAALVSRNTRAGALGRTRANVLLSPSVPEGGGAPPPGSLGGPTLTQAGGKGVRRPVLDGMRVLAGQWGHPRDQRLEQTKTGWPSPEQPFRTQELREILLRPEEIQTRDTHCGVPVGPTRGRLFLLQILPH